MNLNLSGLAGMPLTQTSELEELLHCRICTSEHGSLIRRDGFRPQERVMSYEVTGKQPFETDFYQQMHSRFGNVSCLRGAFAFAKQASTELGGYPEFTIAEFNY